LYIGLYKFDIDRLVLQVVILLKLYLYLTVLVCCLSLYFRIQIIIQVKLVNHYEFILLLLNKEENKTLMHLSMKST